MNNKIFCEKCGNAHDESICCKGPVYEKDYCDLPENEKEKYRAKAREYWSNPQVLLLFPGVEITDDFIEGAALAMYEYKEQPPKEA